MDDHGQIDADEVIRQLQAEYEKAVRTVVRAVNDAPDGHWIDGSEEPARQALGEFRRKAYECALQMRVEAAETSAAFSPSKGSVAPPRGGGSVGGDGQRLDSGASASLRKSRRRDGRSGGRSD